MPGMSPVMWAEQYCGSAGQKSKLPLSSAGPTSVSWISGDPTPWRTGWSSQRPSVSYSFGMETFYTQRSGSFLPCLTSKCGCSRQCKLIGSRHVFLSPASDPVKSYQGGGSCSARPVLASEESLLCGVDGGGVCIDAVVPMMQVARAWDLLRMPVLHYMRASTPEEFTVAKRQRARDSLLEYARLLQGPPLPANQQSADDADSDRSGANNDEGGEEVDAAWDPADASGGTTTPATEATLVSTTCLSCHGCFCPALQRCITVYIVDAL